MTRENYFAFKKALMATDYVYNVTKKGDYITIKPAQNISFLYVDVLYDIMKKIDENFLENNIQYGKVMHTRYGDFEFVEAKHFNTQIYYAKYKIVE